MANTIYIFKNFQHIEATKFVIAYIFSWYIAGIYVLCVVTYNNYEYMILEFICLRFT